MLRRIERSTTIAYLDNLLSAAQGNGNLTTWLQQALSGNVVNVPFSAGWFDKNGLSGEEKAINDRAAEDYELECWLEGRSPYEEDDDWP